jgi:SagB-type dehydrogenase family enzyme
MNGSTKRERETRMSRRFSEALSFTAILFLLLAAMLVTEAPAKEPVRTEAEPAEEADIRAAGLGEISLPEPETSGPLSVEEAIARRRSVREYGERQVLLSEVSQLLWAAQGITGDGGLKRAAPSAGAKYPIEIFVVVGNVETLLPGIYRYRAEGHTLSPVAKGDMRERLCAEALSQECIQAAPLVIVLTGVYERTMEKYGDRGIQYVHIEVGAVAENIYLQAEALGLGTVLMGAFSDGGVKELLGADDVAPLGIMPVGVKQ